MQKGIALILVLISILVITAIGGAFYYWTARHISTPNTPQYCGGDLINSSCPNGYTCQTNPNTPHTSTEMGICLPNIVGKFTVQVIPSGNTETIALSPSDNGKKITVPVGTYIYFRFGVGNYKFTTNPPTGVLESPPGTYNLPMNVIYQLKAVGVGTAEVIVAQTKSDVSPIQNSTMDTGHWKTYKDTSFGLSFMYPPEVSLKEDSDSKNNRRLNIYPSFYNIDTSKLPQDQTLYLKVFQIFVTLENNPQSLTASQIVANDISGITKNNPNDPTLQEMQKSAQKAVKPYTVGQAQGVYTIFGEAHSIPNVYITQNNKLYIISFMGPQGDPAYPETQKLIDQILSTFKFTN